MKPPTRRQIEILRYIALSIQRFGYAPTAREVGREFGFRSTNAFSDHFRRLERKGLVTRDRNGISRCLDGRGFKREAGRARAIRLTPMGYELLGEHLSPAIRSSARGVPVEVGCRCSACGAQTFAPDKPCPMCRRHVPECSVSRVSFSVSAADRVPGRAVGAACS